MYIQTDSHNNHPTLKQSFTFTSILPSQPHDLQTVHQNIAYLSRKMNINNSQNNPKIINNLTTINSYFLDQQFSNDQSNYTSNSTSSRKFMNQQSNNKNILSMNNKSTVNSSKIENTNIQQNERIKLVRQLIQNWNDSIQIIPIIIKMNRMSNVKLRGPLQQLLQKEGIQQWLSPYLQVYIQNQCQYQLTIEKRITKLGIIFWKILQKQGQDIAIQLAKNNINPIQLVTSCYATLMTNILTPELFKSYLFHFIINKQIYFLKFLISYFLFNSTKIIHIIKKSSIKHLNQLFLILKTQITTTITQNQHFKSFLIFKVDQNSKINAKIKKNLHQLHYYN